MKVSQVVFMEWRAIIKSLLMICVVLGVPMLVCGGGCGLTWTLVQNYENNRHAGQPAAMVPIVTQAPIMNASPSTIAYSPDTINIAVDALKPSKQYPVPFTRDPGKDPAGAYFNMGVDVGYGPFPAVYIVPDVWQQAGGRIIISKAPNIVYYTVYTQKGTSSSLQYDRQHNIVYSVEENPEILE